MSRVLRLAAVLASCLALAACPKPETYPDGAGLEGQLDREIAALRQTIRLLEYQVSTCDQAVDRPDRLFTDLHQVFSGTEIAVERRGSATMVTLPGDHLFRHASTGIRAEASMTLDLLATALNLHQDQTIVVEGHTDDTPLGGSLERRYGDNWGLSYQRARSVMEELVDAYGVDESRFSLVARGEHDPIATNDTAAGKSQNRRVVVYIHPPGVR